MSVTYQQQRRFRVPRPLTSFFGRVAEINEVEGLLNRPEVRIVTLTGPGGIGKTRLSFEVARRFEFDDRYSTTFVALAPVASAGAALSAIADALGVRDPSSGDLVQRIAGVQVGNPTLLVLDNLEHVIDLAVDLSALLNLTDDLVLLSTSRVPLRIQGEREYSVPQLLLTDERVPGSTASFQSSEAARLFVDRAIAVNHGFALDESNVAVVMELCHRLDGLPLAIELAAGRTKSLPPSVLLERLSERIGVLEHRTRDVPVRLQTMMAAIDWSYQLLSEVERRAFCRMSIFAGDFSLEAAANLLELTKLEAIDLVSSLVDHSLIRARPSHEGEPCFRLLHVIREFGLERLELTGEIELARTLHAELIARSVVSTYAGQFSAEQTTVFQRLDHIRDDIVPAIHWAISNRRLNLAARIAGNLWQYWFVRGDFAAGRIVFESLIKADHDFPLEMVPDLYFGYSFLSGSPAQVVENVAAARKLLEIGQFHEDPRAIAAGTLLVGMRKWDTTGLAASLRAIDLWIELDEPIWAARASTEVSRIARETGDLDRAEQYAHKACNLLSGTGHLWGIAQASAVSATIAHARGSTFEALVMLRSAMELILPTGDVIGVLRIIEFITEIAGSLRQYPAVVRLLAAIASNYRSIGFEIRYSFDEAIFLQLERESKVSLGKVAFEEHWHAGSQFSLADAIDEALSVSVAETATSGNINSRTGTLSRRELQVLRHIVTGETDQQIADELYVSYRTVTTHVTNILNKLGANSRTEAAAIAVRERLLPE